MEPHTLLMGHTLRVNRGGEERSKVAFDPNHEMYEQYYTLFSRIATLALGSCRALRTKKTAATIREVPSWYDPDYEIDYENFGPLDQATYTYRVTNGNAKVRGL